MYGKMIVFAAGIGVGYLLGAKAGRGRYDAIKQKASEVWEDPGVQRIVHETGDAAKEAASAAQTGLAGAAQDATEKLKKS